MNMFHRVGKNSKEILKICSFHRAILNALDLPAKTFAGRFPSYPICFKQVTSAHGFPTTWYPVRAPPAVPASFLRRTDAGTGDRIVPSYKCNLKVVVLILHPIWQDSFPTPVDAFRRRFVLHAPCQASRPPLQYASPWWQKFWLCSLIDSNVVRDSCCSSRRSSTCTRVLLCRRRVHHDFRWLALPEPDVRGEVDPSKSVSEISHCLPAWRRSDWDGKLLYSFLPFCGLSRHWFGVST